MTLLDPKTLRIFAEETAVKTEREYSIIEKDYWVVWLLDLIFSGPYADKLTFKGGTSLSKAYNVIDRFSEDVDMTIDRSLIHVDPDKSLETPDISSSQRNKRSKIFTSKVEDFVEREFAPWLETEIKKQLVSREGDTSPVLRADPNNQAHLFFDYPRKPDAPQNNYIPPFVRLELGARGEPTPQGQHIVTSYIEKEFPHLFEKRKPVCINVLAIERTFWEKLTILHSVCCRPEDKSQNERFSKHYYDVYHLAQDTKLVASILADTELLSAIVENKKTYFSESWDWYSTAKRGSFKLVPSLEKQKSLVEDYKAMQDMIFGDTPDFDTILKSLEKLEKSINDI